MEMDPKHLERLFDKNVACGVKTDYLLQVFDGAEGYLRVRMRTRPGLSEFEWQLSTRIHGAREKSQKGNDEVAQNLLRSAIESVVGAVRHLTFYTPNHAVELWEIMRIGLTSKLPIVDAVAALAPREDSRG
jgi:hypothetical protein